MSIENQLLSSVPSRVIVFPFKTRHPKVRVVRPTNRSMFLS